MNATVQSFKDNLRSRILSFLNYFRIVIQSNNLITSLNTNGIITIAPYTEQIEPRMQFIDYYLDSSSYEKNEDISCSTVHSISPTSFYSYSNENRY